MSSNNHRLTVDMRGQSGAVVFDKARSSSLNRAQKIGLSGGYLPESLIFGHFRNLRDRPARETVTHILCGDPEPGRPRPADEPPPVAPNRICTESGPVLLTFRELEAAKKLTHEGRV